MTHHVTNHVLRLLLAVAVAGGAGACTDERPTDEEYDDIAYGVAPLLSVSLAEGGTLQTSLGFVDGDEPGWMTRDTTGTFIGAVGGLRWELAVACFDGFGRHLPDCGDDTDRASARFGVGGEVDALGYQAEFELTGSWVFHGLATDVVSVEGRARFSGSMSFGARSTALYVEGAVELTVPRHDPLAARGTLDGRIDADTVDGGDYRVALHVELDGNGGATLELDGDLAYDVDLRTGAVTGP